MKLKMSKNSLFAILLRKPWWISVIVGVVLSLAASLMFPKALAAYGVSAGLPFFVIAIIAAMKQWRTPSAAQIAHMLETVNALSWRDFSESIEAAYRRDGYEVRRLPGPAADFAITKTGYTSLVSCKRWKAASTGIEPLRELHTAAEAGDARESIYITVGQLSENARRFAEEKHIRVVQGAGLAELLRGMVQSVRKKTAD
jgi:restriction system protein